MEYKRIKLPFATKFNTLFQAIHPFDNDDTKEADEEISRHLKNGWRIVSTTPITGSTAYDEKGIGSIGLPEKVYTYTICVEVFLVKE